MSQLSVHAAGQCSEGLALLITPDVFRGWLEAAGMDAGFAFDRVMEERRRERAVAGAAGQVPWWWWGDVPLPLRPSNGWVVMPGHAFSPTQKYLQKLRKNGENHEAPTATKIAPQPRASMERQLATSKVDL